MKNTIALLLSAVTLANCQDQESHSARFTVQVKDDTGAPIADYTVSASHFDMNKRNNTDGDSWTGETRQSDKMGKATFEFGLWTNEIGLNFQANTPPQYYPTIAPIYQFQRVDNGRWVPENPLIEVVLKRKRKPIPMYAKDYYLAGAGILRIPVAGRNCAYDLEVGDWVAPDGTGKTKDIIFNYTTDGLPSGDYKQVVRITFPSPQDGLIAFDKDPSLGSELASAHMAPEDGYIPLLEKRRTVEGVKITDDAKRDRNYYFRVRSKVDVNGKLVSANYGKIYGDFMSFTYYFNPTPNDRNIEFDPTRNLFRGDSPELKVVRP